MINYISRFAGKTGYKFLYYLNDILSLSGLLYRILKIFVTGSYKGKKIVRVVIIEQIYFTAVQALWLIIPIALIIGTVFFLQFSKIASQYDFGKIAVVVLMRETGPIVAAVLVILRSATAVTIEIGYMNVGKEMDFIQMSGVDPIALICIPRLVGITSAILCLFLVFDFVAVFGGYIVAWAMSDLSLSRFLGMLGRSITIGDTFAVLFKALSFGIIISVISIFRGFEVKKSLNEIPVKTSKSAVESFFYCFLFNILISILFSIIG
ncbi:MAG: hypothetical protein CSA18_00350 [Deltaproteobacteria bacterium]|nr:MAG: hypothetical protein CSA18_00350 [Deltaproteobacteria bacterium]